MYLYKVGYWSYEESPDIILGHTELFAKKQFDKTYINWMDRNNM